MTPLKVSGNAIASIVIAFALIFTAHLIYLGNARQTDLAVRCKQCRGSNCSSRLPVNKLDRCLSQILLRVGKLIYLGNQLTFLTCPKRTT